MTDITVIILAGKEHLHMRRCLTRLAPLAPMDVFVVESQSDDGTHAIAVECGATCVFNKWPGLYAKQFNWALDSLPIKSTWILRLDADEYLTEKTISILRERFELNGKACGVDSQDDVSAYMFALGRTFWGKKVSRGVGTFWLTRLFKYRIGRCEDKSMDEHIVVSEGRIVQLQGAMFIDDNLNGIDWWTDKHLGDAAREAQDAIVGFKKGQKGIYYRLPKYSRAVAYFFYRYVCRGGFLDGRDGFKWAFFQGLWYRLLVDVKIEELIGENGK